MTQYERVWTRIKQIAKELASRGEHPTQQRAKEIVRCVIKGEHAETAPIEAVEYLSGELRGLVAEYSVTVEDVRSERIRDASGHNDARKDVGSR